MDDFPGPFARRARETAEELRRDWDCTARDAAENRRLDELHASRDDYRALLSGHLRLLEDYLALTQVHQRAFGPNPSRVSELTAAVSELKRLHDELFPRWQTADDLARILIEKFSLPADALRELATRHAPPASWLNETADPFSDD
jgi:hypothetical protein